MELRDDLRSAKKFTEEDLDSELWRLKTLQWGLQFREAFQEAAIAEAKVEELKKGSRPLLRGEGPEPRASWVALLKVADEDPSTYLSPRTAGDSVERLRRHLDLLVRREVLGTA